MATTAFYARLAQVPEAGKSQSESPPAFSNIAATTSAFTIVNGGAFVATVIGSTFGTAALQALGPDDTTWLPVTIQVGVAAGVQTYVAAFVANGYGLVYLSPGRYRWALA